MDDEIRFGVLHEDGTVSDERSLPKDAVRKCPHLIMLPEHYREDDSCRCDDESHVEMQEWGYKWDGKKWVA